MARVSVVLFALGVLRCRKGSRAPHPVTISRWACKIGLHKLKTAEKKNGGWTAIADLSIHIGDQRVFCLLRAQQARIDEGHPLTLADVEVVGLHVVSKGTAEDLRGLLVADFRRVGFPDGLVTDGGADIVCAVKSLNEVLGTRITHIEDISHLCARLLKKELKVDSDELDAFSKDLVSCAAQVRQTDLAYLSPPAMRTKARFMNLSKVANWASKVILLLSEIRAGRPTKSQTRARRYFAWVRRYDSLMDKILVVTTALDRIQRIVKHRGLDANSALEVEIELGRLGFRNPTARRLRLWVDKNLALAARIRRPVLVTSDIIESLFGRWKSVIGYHRASELTTSVLLLPALCGELSPQLVHTALRSVKVSELESWKQHKIGTTLRSKRTILRLVRKTRRRRVQKTEGNPFAATA